MEFSIFCIFVFIFGLIIGSFLNCVIYRLSLPGFSFWKSLGGKSRSYCPHCKHNLIWLDLIPVFSFLFLGGKCRYCHKKISVQYPLVELATGLIFLLIFQQFGTFDLMYLVFLFYIAASLIIIFMYDLKHYLIPDNILFPAITVAFLYRLFYFFPMWNFMLAVIIASGFFLCIWLVSKGKWMGFGDVKLAILLGLLLGWPEILVGLFLSFFFGAIIGSGLIFLNKKGLKSEVPFAPFLIAGTLVALCWGQQIINWYFNFFLF